MILAHDCTFGPFRFDPAEGRLTRDGDAVRVPAKALALLTLLSRAGYLVSHAELMADTIRRLGAAFDRREEGPLGMNYSPYDFVRADPRFAALYQRVFAPR